MTIECEDCSGYGEVDTWEDDCVTEKHEPCISCNGTGYIETPDKEET